SLFVVAFVARQVRQASLNYPDNSLVTRENYLKIKEGMTRMEVEDILGPGIFNGIESKIVDANGNFVSVKDHGATREKQKGTYEGLNGKPYQEITEKLRWHSGNTKVIRVTFFNGKVTSKKEEGLSD